MLLLSHEDEHHKELQNCARQIRCRLEDMTPVPNMGATFRLPNTLFPPEASELAKFFYDRQREKMYKWARRKELQITKKASYGPQIVLLKEGGRLYVGNNRVLFSIVIPMPSKQEMVDKKVNYSDSTAEASLVYHTGASTVDAGATPVVRVGITSPVSDGFPARSFPDLEIGDVIVLEAGEQLFVGAESSSAKDKSICLISALHITYAGMGGKGGWKDDTVEKDGESQPEV